MRTTYAMLTIHVLNSSTIRSQGWTDKILALDRENMTPILRAAGLGFSDEKRRQGLRDPSIVSVVLVDGETLVGYVEFCTDSYCDANLFLASLQLDRRYRRGIALGILIVECAEIVKTRSFIRLRAGVHRSNREAIQLYRKLGFQLIERRENETIFDAIGRRELLNSERIVRLARHLIGKYKTGIIDEIDT